MNNVKEELKKIIRQLDRTRSKIESTISTISRALKEEENK